MRKHRKGWKVDCFRWSGADSFQLDELVIQLMGIGGNRRQVHPPAPVIHVQRFTSRQGNASYVFLESPEKAEPLALTKLVRKMGKDSEPKLRRAGVVRNRAFAIELLNALKR